MVSSSSILSPIDNNQFDQEKIMSTLSIILSRLDRIEKMLFELKDSVKINKITEHHNHQHPSSDLIEIQTNQQINNDNLEQQQQQMDLSSDSTSLPDDDDDDEEEYFTSVESNDESSKQTCSTRITTNNVDDSNDNGHQSNIKNLSLPDKNNDSLNMTIDISDDDDIIDVVNVDADNVNECLPDRHHRMHSGDKRYKCDHCGYATKYKGNLKNHIRIHTGDKPYKCDHCPFATVYKSSLKSHIRIHTGENPYKCDQCSYGTSFKNALQIHTRIHTGDKPYKCKQCEYSTTQQCNLQSHIRIHTGDKPYKCDNCQYATAHNSSLKSHKLRIHPSCHQYTIKNTILRHILTYNPQK